MFRAIRKHLTPSMAIAMLALVFAATGGAFAASGHGGGSGSATATAAKSKAKSKPKAGARGPAGPKGATGATGPAGPAGTAGAKGETGAAGAAGAQGTLGEKGETGAVGPQGPKGTNGTNGTDGTNGTNGTIGFTKTLPAEETETGAWSISGNHQESQLIISAVSFSIPLAAALDNNHVYYVGVEEVEQHTAPAECPGTVAEPKAAAGYLCVYEKLSFGFEVRPNTTTAFVKITSPGGLLPVQGGVEGAGVSGAEISVSVSPSEEEATGWGSWAVTAPKAS